MQIHSGFGGFLKGFTSQLGECKSYQRFSPIPRTDFAVGKEKAHQPA